MLKARTLGTFVAIGALAALPACSMFGGGSSSGQYQQSSYNRGAYNSGSSQTAAAEAPQPGTTTTREAAITPHMIREVQHRLKEANLYSGRIDGVWGPMTQNGLREWQQKHNVNSTGQLDMATLQAMNISTGNDNQQYGQSNGNEPNADQNGQNAANTANAPNYSTAGNHPSGNSNYTSNMNNMPQNNQPNATQPMGNNNTNPPATGQNTQSGH